MGSTERSRSPGEADRLIAVAENDAVIMGQKDHKGGDYGISCFLIRSEGKFEQPTTGSHVRTGEYKLGNRSPVVMSQPVQSLLLVQGLVGMPCCLAEGESSSAGTSTYLVYIAI